MDANHPTRTFIIPQHLSGGRVDLVTVELAPDLTRSAIQRLLRDGCLLLDGSPPRAADKVVTGQVLTLQPPGIRPLEVTAEAIPLDVVFEDEVLLVVNKPPGMVVHPAHGHYSGTLVNALLAHCQLSTGSGVVRPGIVHRLDQDTSGLLLVAKRDDIHARLTQMVEEKAVIRRYSALVWGIPQPPADRIETHLGRHPQHRTMMAVLPEGKGRLALTDYHTTATYAWNWTEVVGRRPRLRLVSALSCQLQTGRTHQIRVHLAHQGHPLLGDPLYGDRERDQGGPEDLRQLITALPGQALHAAELAFTHPLTGVPLRFSAKLPEALKRLWEWLEGHVALGGATGH